VRRHHVRQALAAHEVAHLLDLLVHFSPFRN
jgi:hypothetical protein